MKKGTLRVDVRRLKMSLLKLPNDNTRAVVFLLTIMLLPVAIAVVVSLGHYNCETGGDEQWSQLD